MRFARLALLVVTVTFMAMPAVAPAAAFAAPGRPALADGQRAPMLLAFRGGFRFGGLRSRGYYGGFGRTRSRHPFLRHVVRTAAWLYILHLFFSHGGLSILLWIVIIALVISLVRRRRRRYAY